MKTFSNLITESIVVPQFHHKDLNTPRDPDGKFWKAIEAANETTDKAPKGSYAKAVKAAKDLYSALVAMENDESVTKARDMVSDVVKLLDRASEDTVEEMSATDMRQLRNYLFIIANIDQYLSRKVFYANATVDIKAGYVPFKGATKDPKIKYRMVVNAASPISGNIAKEIVRTITDQSPLHLDYVAGIEWKKDNTAFAVLFTNSPGYKR